MKRKILFSLLVLIFMFMITGCDDNKETEENTEFNSVATYMILTPENNGKDITIDSQIKYQEDLSDEIVEIYSSKSITEEIYEEYGFKIIPTVKSINEKNTMYESKLSCGNLSEEDCIEVHRLYTREFMTKGEMIYNLYINRVDDYTISK